MAISTRLSHLKKVHDSIYLKKYYLIKQSLYALKEEEKAISTGVVTPPNVLLLVPLLPLTDLFIFNPFFSLFPNLFSYNTP